MCMQDNRNGLVVLNFDARLSLHRTYVMLSPWHCAIAIIIVVCLPTITTVHHNTAIMSTIHSYRIAKPHTQRGG